MSETGDAPRDGVTRREFLAAVVAAAAVPLASTVACAGEPAVEAPALVGLAQKGGRPIAGGYVNDGSEAGHRIRDRKAPGTATERRRVAVAIVGAGMGGLSAGWKLDKLGVRDWVMLELGDRAGGNSRSGASSVSRYPWGAHYVPVPGKDAVYVRELMRDLGVLSETGEWDERTLCHSPQERVWQYGRWHPGLEPFDALPKAEIAQFDRFETMIDEWRATGAFTVPTAQGQARARTGAAAARVSALDRQTAAAWMTANGFTSKALRWWVEYGTRDDYGASLETASAWAAVHYFAGRDSEEIGPLTWPEGNDFIAGKLAARAGARLMTGAPATSIERMGTRWLVRTPRLDVECDVVIWSSPLFVLPYVAPAITPPVALEYAPWVVANVTLDREPQQRGAEPAWDNVIYGSTSLGYVDATHQSLAQHRSGRVWTWYHAVVDRAPRDARRWMAARPWAAWRDEIMADLARAHPDIGQCVSRIDVMQWGHAMARPTPGLLGRVDTLQSWKPADRFYVAHADLSGLSLFEEAQWHGVHAAEQAARVVNGTR
ncbi:MAG: NAD(P)-binding protein [Gemmatimonadota bacterium]